MSAPLVELRSLVKRYEVVEQADAAAVLSGIDLEIRQGESIAIVGPSGSGKSTLLNVIGGLLPPTEGEVLFEGRNLGTMSADQLASLRNREIGYIFQAHHLLPQCTALENVLLPTLVLGEREQRREAGERAAASCTRASPPRVGRSG